MYLLRCCKSVSVLFALVFLLLCSQALFAVEFIEGYWFDKNDRTVLYIDGKTSKLQVLREGKVAYTLAYKRLDDGSYQVQTPDGLNVFAVLTLEPKGLAFAMKKVNRTAYLQRVANIKPEDMVGKWCGYENNDNVESYTFISQSKNSYQTQHVELNHNAKTFMKTANIDVKYSLERGFVFTDLAKHKDDNYVYYALNFTGDSVQFMGSDGYQWTDKKCSEHKIPRQPVGYSIKTLNTKPLSEEPLNKP